MSTPNQLSDTPRTDAAWAKTFIDDDDQCRAGNAATDMRDECATLERELAAERVRLDWLSARGFEHRHHETGDHLGYEWTISSYSEFENVTLRDVIDAAMKEGAK